MVLRWLDAALADLRGIKAYIAEENLEAARRVIASIRNETGILINQPAIGRVGRIADTREMWRAFTKKPTPPAQELPKKVGREARHLSNTLQFAKD